MLDRELEYFDLSGGNLQQLDKIKILTAEAFYIFLDNRKAKDRKEKGTRPSANPFKPKPKKQGK